MGLRYATVFFGFYIVEYEQKGKDRAVYGENLYKEIAKRCKHINGMSKFNLYIYKTFYQMYPNIFQSVTGKLITEQNQAKNNEIVIF